MRRAPPPLRVTRPPPSSTTCELVLTTFAVAARVIVIGSGPQENVMMPPAATAATTAAEVQLAGVPEPMTRVGCEVSTGRAASGSVTPPDGLPGAGSVLVTALAAGARAGTEPGIGLLAAADDVTEVSAELAGVAVDAAVVADVDDGRCACEGAPEHPVTSSVSATASAAADCPRNPTTADASPEWILRR